MTDAASNAPGPGTGPGGVPAAIALTPILAARYRTQDLEAIRAAAPGARLVTIGFDGHPDGPLDEVEVMLRGRLPADTFDRILGRAPALRWVHSATAGVERVLTPASRERGLVITNARGVFSRPIAEYVMLMILSAARRLPQLLELQAERTGSRSRRGSCATSRWGSSASGRSGGRWARWRPRSAAASWPPAGARERALTPRTARATSRSSAR